MRKKVITFLILLTIATLLIAAPANPANYTVNLTQDSWLAGNSWNFENTNISNLYMARLDFKIVGPAPIHDNITVLVDSSDSQGRFINVSDPTKFFYTEFKISNLSINTFPYPVLFSPANYKGSNLNLTIVPRAGSNNGYEGTYSMYFRLRFFVDYGTNDQIELEDYEAVLNILLYFRNKTPPPAGQSYFSHLFVEQYPSADNIDIVNLMTFNNPLTVGAVNFSSNDNRPNSKYKITISPNQYHPSGYFAFHKTTSPASTIPFKVYAPSRNTPRQTAFTLSVPARGPANFWQDYFELAISDVNYNNQTLVGGDYVSEIKIELTID